MTWLPTLADVYAAAHRLEGRVRRTPLLLCDSIRCWLKPESLQLGGAFKIRGALNRMLCLSQEERGRGVVAWSSGNHAQGVALAARMLGIPANIVMPEDSQPHKVQATVALGARVVQEGVTVANRTDVAMRLAAAEGAVPVPPFDDPWIVAGQGTVGLEIVTDLYDVDAIVVPLGGGGLLSGVALAARSIKPSVKVYGVEPRSGNDGQRTFHEGHIVCIDPPSTLADGARTQSIGKIPFQLIREWVEDIVTVEDTALLEAIGTLARDARLVVEPTGALAVAAVMSGALRLEGNVCVVLSGGNIAPELLARSCGVLRP